MRVRIPTQAARLRSKVSFTTLHTTPTDPTIPATHMCTNTHPGGKSFNHKFLFFIKRELLKELRATLKACPT